jgi:hypothetical protein
MSEALKEAEQPESNSDRNSPALRKKRSGCGDRIELVGAVREPPLRGLGRALWGPNWKG